MSFDPTSLDSDASPPDVTLDQQQELVQGNSGHQESASSESYSFFDLVLAQHPDSSSTDKTPSQIAGRDLLGEFLQSEELSRQLEILLELGLWSKTQSSARDFQLQVAQAITEIDELIEDQLNAILHHPRFQGLEASWRGLEKLVDESIRQGTENIVIRALHLPWNELAKDLEKATEFDQSKFFKKIYEEEFGTPGGQPYGMLIGDYEIHPRPVEGRKFDDIETLKKIAGVAAAAFCPFITSAAPSMFGLDDFSGLQHVEDLERGFEGLDFLQWRNFREMDDARFVGITVPRVLMRRPWAFDEERVDGFQFSEDTAARNQSKYLWGNAAYAYGEVVIRAFAQSGWLAELRGVKRDTDWGGLVTNLPVHSFGTDREGVALRSSTEIALTDLQESSLSELGFLPICHCWDTEYSAFYSSASAQKPRAYDRASATQNAKISSMLHYMFCVSRFAHFLKVIARDRIGSHLTPEECERELRQWLVRYVTPDEHASVQAKARMPLRDANVRILTDPSKPGSYLCTMHLMPHYQLDNVAASLRLNTSLKPLG